ncbi:VOC family protein [Schumannella sp. 10F1B-5-1]|uniref:VOC family protein n=1 Tax=Schumannella sp. 10F1B-5-1 TaxID=2590780 RepID=UPI0011307FFC|nr:VOC family protein [Schumannella sp. 10F1B-5-1]TPW70067.1 VOC family protein [Schumannella sp. 10F1B-5-1]
MLTTTGAFSGFSVSDPERARDFYGRVLGLDVEDAGMGGITRLSLPGGGSVILYPKENHEPATYTVLNLEVADVGVAIRELGESGLEPIRYEGMPQDDDGAMRGHGPDIAWFTDPFGNIFSVIHG